MPEGAFAARDRRGAQCFDEVRRAAGRRCAARNASLAATYSYSAPPSMPGSCVACATIVASTVSRSSVEPTAWPTALRALSWSSDRVSSSVRASSSRNRRAVLDRDDRLVGESAQHRDLLGAEGSRDGRATAIAPSGSPSRNKGMPMALMMPISPASLNAYSGSRRTSSMTTGLRSIRARPATRPRSSGRGNRG